MLLDETDISISRLWLKQISLCYMNVHFRSVEGLKRKYQDTFMRKILPPCSLQIKGCNVSFLPHDLVTGGLPHTGSRQFMISSEKAMAPHSSTLAWKIPWMEEPGRLQSMGSWRVRHDWVTSLSLFTFMHWRRKWQPTPVFLPGESQGRGSLVGCRLWGHMESDTTELS